MTDRFHSLVVVLDKDMRDEDAEALINAIMMMKNVISVEGNISDVVSLVAMARARSELSMKIFEALK